MKLLFDQNISYRIKKHLESDFPTCEHISNCGLLNKEDTDIWQYAKQNNFLIVTFDADFYEISLTQGFPPKIIWLRTGNLTTSQIANLILSHKVIILEFSLNDESACLEIE